MKDETIYCDATPLDNIIKQITEGCAKQGLTQKTEPCYCVAKTGKDMLSKLEKKCRTFQGKDPYKPNMHLWNEFAACLHFGNGVKGVIISVESFNDEAERYAERVWEESTFGRELEKKLHQLEIGSVNCYSYGMKDGNNMEDFECSPNGGESTEFVNITVDKKGSWRERMEIPKNVAVVRDDEFLKKLGL